MIGRVKAPRIGLVARARRAGISALAPHVLCPPPRAERRYPPRGRVNPTLLSKGLTNMRARFLFIASAAALALTSSIASAGLATNGLTINGLTINGLTINGLSANGINPNGREINGSQLNGTGLNGMSVNGTQLGPVANADARVDSIILGQAR
jgi:hypothetical protein